MKPRVIKPLYAWDAWMARVQAIMIARCGMGPDDLPDYCYRDAYDNKLTCEQCAKDAIRYAHTCF
jgi:hypothetical protein